MRNSTNQLPNDVLHQILDKVMEAKWLFRCSLVSKNLASIVYQSHTVSFQVPHHWKPLELKNLTQSSALSVEELYALCRDIIFNYKSSSNPEFVTSIMKGFISKFTSIKSLLVKVSLSGDIDPSCNNERTVLKWRAKASSKGLVSFIILSAKELTTQYEHDEDEDEDEGELTQEEHHSMMSRVCGRVRDCTLMCSSIESLCTRIPVVEVRDTRGEGQIIRDTSSPGGYEIKSSESVWMKTWFKPTLRLPMSKCVMKEVKLIFVNNGTPADVMINNEAFEDGVFNDAAIKMISTGSLLWVHWYSSRR